MADVCVGPSEPRPASEGEVAGVPAREEPAAMPRGETRAVKLGRKPDSNWRRGSIPIFSVSIPSAIYSAYASPQTIVGWDLPIVERTRGGASESRQSVTSQVKTTGRRVTIPS